MTAHRQIDVGKLHATVHERAQQLNNDVYGHTEGEFALYEAMADADDETPHDDIRVAVQFHDRETGTDTVTRTGGPDVASANGFNVVSYATTDDAAYVIAANDWGECGASRHDSAADVPGWPEGWP